MLIYLQDQGELVRLVVLKYLQKLLIVFDLLKLRLSLHLKVSCNLSCCVVFFSQILSNLSNNFVLNQSLLYLNWLF